MIIPVLNDTAALVALLAQLAVQEPQPAEVIVVNGVMQPNDVSQGDVGRVCADAGARYLIAPAGRGQQLRAGVADAKGDILWFLHADARLPANATRAIHQALAAGAASGFFQFRFSGVSTLRKRIIEQCVRWRCRLGTVYGDQGLFAQRSVYDLTPGFSATPLFEEVPLVKALRRQGNFVALPECIVVDSRRWDQRGYWIQTLVNRLLALGYALGISTDRLALWYRGRD